MSTPEKLNLWDRIFNRERREMIDKGEERWGRWSPIGIKLHDYMRCYVDYRVIDRVTGSERIEREYLN